MGIEEHPMAPRENDAVHDAINNENKETEIEKVSTSEEMSTSEERKKKKKSKKKKQKKR